MPRRPEAFSPPRIAVPQAIRWHGTSGGTLFSAIEIAGPPGTPPHELMERTRDMRPPGTLPAEGYLLEVSPAGARGIAADAAGRLRAERMLAELDGAGRPHALIADWPDQAWRGFLAMGAPAEELPVLKQFIRDHLASWRCNVLLLHMSNFRFRSRPECTDDWGAWSVAQVRELVEWSRQHGVRVIPVLQSLGHQDDYRRSPRFPGPWIGAHPDWEEPPDRRDSLTDPDSADFCSRSLCPRHPEVKRAVPELVGELLDAFGTGAIHVGLDEVFVIGSTRCPRCRGVDPAVLFAEWVRTLHAVIKGRKAEMLMWGDRLLDARATGDNAWVASLNGTHRALDRIPRDIVICDWHYDERDAYPSLDIFLQGGFRVWPTVFKPLRAATAFMRAATAKRDPRILGTLATHWSAIHGIAAVANRGTLNWTGTSPGAPVGEYPADVQTASRVVQAAWNARSPGTADTPGGARR